MKYNSIREYLEKTGTTEKEFAERIGASQPFVNLLKQGKRTPSPDLAQTIEEVTGIPLRRLLFPKDAA